MPSTPAPTPTPTTPSKITPNTEVNLTTSHAAQRVDLLVDRNYVRGNVESFYSSAISFADYDADGDIDLFLAHSLGTEDRVPAEVYLNDGENNLVLVPDFIQGDNVGFVSPRKSIIADFNNDNRPDVFVVDHGFDEFPFPGAYAQLFLSSDNGLVEQTGFESYVGFQHGASAADIDNDNDIDIFVTDNNQPFFLINDGQANFSYSDSQLGGFASNAIYTAELYDVDGDGFVDLLVAGHEFEGFETAILWGDQTGEYSMDKATVLPTVQGYGVITDIDLGDINSDGITDIILLRTGDGENAVPFYDSFDLQIIIGNADRTFVDDSKLRIAKAPAQALWFDWLRLQDINLDGHLDIIPEDLRENKVWLNDGNGIFTEYRLEESKQHIVLDISEGFWPEKK